MSTDKKTIDAYNKYAESWVKSKRDGTSIFHLYLEKPTMYSKLPDLKGKTVLCIGCGSGEEVKYLHSLGAKKIVGIDISERLIEIAKKSYPHLEFYVMDVERLDFPKGSFDFVFSSLTMHYLETWSPALQSIHHVLKNGGIFLFSITHPFFSATQLQENKEEKTRMFGYKDVKNGDTCELYGDYLNRHQVKAHVSKELTVTNYHRPLSIIVKEILNAGFEIVDILEPKALKESKQKYQKFWKIHQKIPEFMIVELIKK